MKANRRSFFRILFGAAAAAPAVMKVAQAAVIAGVPHSPIPIIHYPYPTSTVCAVFARPWSILPPPSIEVLNRAVKRHVEQIQAGRSERDGYGDLFPASFRVPGK